MNEPEAEEFVSIIDRLARLLHEVPIPLIAAAMSEDCTTKSVERCLKQRQHWVELFSKMADDLTGVTDQFDALVERLNKTTNSAKHIAIRFDSIDTTKLNTLAELCDRLERHAKTGVLAAVIKLSDLKRYEPS